MTLITSKEAGMVYPHEVDEKGVVVRKNVNADKQAGDPEAAAPVTGRPNDLPVEERKPALANSTLAERRRRRESEAEAQAKAVDSGDVENKAVGTPRTKRK